MSNNLNKEQIKKLLPHREPMLLIDELNDIKKLLIFLLKITKSSKLIPVDTLIELNR